MKCKECKYYNDDNVSICSMCINNPTYNNNFTKKKLSFEEWWELDNKGVSAEIIWKAAQENK